ncbi:MAG: pilus assembly protein PilM [Sedimentisphaerales bacterium]|nr:pilus assembly protein PilM [Sedimentisphaerales bacterium]
MTKAPWNYLKKQLSPIGLDWATSGLRAVQLYRRGREIGVFSAMESPRTVFEDTTPILSTESTENTDDHDEEIKNLLASLRDDGCFSGTSVIIHCPADQMDLRPITLPGGAEQLPQDTIMQTIRLQMKQHINFDIDKAIIDYYFLSTASTPENIKLIAVTADGDWIRQRVSQLQTWGWQCAGVIPLPAALWRLTKTMSTTSPQDADDSTPLLKPILCIGQRHMVLTVHLDEGPVFSRVFAFGGDVMADALALRMQVNFTQAHQLIRSYGLSGAEPSPAAATATAAPLGPQQEIARAVRTALHDEITLLVEGLTRALNYVINEYPQAKLDRVRCCGGGAHTPGLAHELGAQLDWPVELITHPLLDDIQTQWPVSRALAGQWATALALAYPQEGVLY